MRPQSRNSELESLPNIGKVTANELRKIGINTPEEFLARDPYEIFDELKSNIDPTLCKSFLAGLVGAKLGRKWNEVIKEAVAHYEKQNPGCKWQSAKD